MKQESLSELGAKLFSNKTLFVIGAGASNEFGLPLGIDLIEHVKIILDFRFEFPDRMIGAGDIHVHDTIRAIARANNENPSFYFRKCSELNSSVSLNFSIDNFLHSNFEDRKLVKIGKIAIVKSILDAERNSNLYFNINKEMKFNIDSIRNTWLLPFIRMLNANRIATKSRIYLKTFLLFASTTTDALSMHYTTVCC